MIYLTKRQRRKLAQWVDYHPIDTFNPDGNTEHAMILIEHMQEVPESDDMIKEMQLSMCIAGLKYMSRHVPSIT